MVHRIQSIHDLAAFESSSEPACLTVSKRRVEFTAKPGLGTNTPKMSMPRVYSDTGLIDSFSNSGYSVCFSGQTGEM